MSDLPAELLVGIFKSTDDIGDAVRLSKTSRILRTLWQNNLLHIGQAIVSNMPSDAQGRGSMRLFYMAIFGYLLRGVPIWSEVTLHRQQSSQLARNRTDGLWRTNVRRSGP